MDPFTVGLIGLGAMGEMYARRLSQAGWRVVGSDLPSNYEKTKERFADTKVEVVRDGHLVSRVSDYIIYSVEACNIAEVVAQYGPSTKFGACVGGQTSCKAPEVAAFEKYLMEDVEIIPIHSLHGPGVDPTGQPLVIVQHRARDSTLKKIEEVLSCLKSKFVYLSADQHDIITADTQAVTHMAFLSMGTAWKANDQYPWKHGRLSGGLENAKINIAMRIYSNSWHVYAGLAITNPSAHVQTLQYAKSITSIFKLMVIGDREALSSRLFAARDYVFKRVMEDPSHSLLLSDNLLGNFSLSKDLQGTLRHPNSHLSLLGILDAWHQSKIIPYDHIICGTPLFRILLGVTEYLCVTPGLLEKCVEDSLSSVSFRGDDLEFALASRAWATVVGNGDFTSYRRMFEDVQDYFKHSFPEAQKIGNEMIKAINEHQLRGSPRSI